MTDVDLTITTDPDLAVMEKTLGQNKGMNTDKNLNMSLGANFGKRLCRNLAKNMACWQYPLWTSADPSSPKNAAIIDRVRIVVMNLSANRSTLKIADAAITCLVMVDIIIVMKKSLIPKNKAAAAPGALVAIVDLSARLLHPLSAYKTTLIYLKIKVKFSKSSLPLKCFIFNFISPGRTGEEERT